MRKGDIQVDWIVGFFIFLVFLGWSYQYYVTFFRYNGAPLDQVAVSINDKIIENITNKVYDIPVSYSSPLQETNSIMSANLYWNSEGEVNSTMVLSNTSSNLQCIISGNTIYWRSNVVAGQNNFTIRLSNRTAAVKNCSSSFSTSSSNFTIPLAGDMKIMISQSAIDSMTATKYEDFKSFNNINRDFRVMLEVTGGNTTNYGSVPPNSSNVFSQEKWFALEETNSKIKVTTLVW